MALGFGFGDARLAAQERGMVDQSSPDRGELKADLSMLNRFYHGPRHAGESNHLLDMWEGGKLAMYVRHAGLTNNHALIINSHSRSVFSKWRKRQALYPHESLVPEGRHPPLFSVRDLATFLGPERRSGIHNLVVGGCNLRGEFDSAEWRHHFPNTTNVIHVSAGDPGYQPMLTQVFFLPSHQIEPVYERTVRARDGSVQFYLESHPSRGGTRMEPYLAELFKPGMTEPYRTQIAGRELFLPPPSAGGWLAAQSPRIEVPARH